MITIPNPLRRLRFTLRTLFVGVTAAACWFGYQLNWIRQRHEILPPDGTPKTAVFACHLGEHVRAPGLLWLFGEQGHGLLITFRDCSEEQAERIRRLFPDAQFRPRTVNRDPPSQVPAVIARPAE